MIKIPDSFSLSELTVLTGVAGLLNGAKVHLFKAPFTPSRTSTIAALLAIEADFTGYAASSTVVWGTPYVDSTNGPQVVAPGKQFTAGSPVIIANTIYGAFVTDAAGAVLLYAELFATPIIISAPAQAIVYVPVFGEISQ